jgi:FkbM family methyltransferase
MTRRGLARLAARALPRGVVVPILRGPLRGCWWITGAAAGTGGGAAILVNLTDPEVLAQAAALVTPASICCDIGANVGLFSLLWGRRARHVYAFEPLPRNVAYLHRTLALNRVRNVTILPWAVSAFDGPTALAPGADVARGHLDSCGAVPVMAITLDTFLAHYSIVPTLIKIDVEGAEVDVLKGALKTLAAHRPTLLLSTHSPSLTRTCCAMLQSAGYRCEALTADDSEWMCGP